MASDLAAEIRAKEAAELERRLAGPNGPEECVFCGHVFRAKGWDRWERAWWIPEAHCVSHRICWQRHKESR